MYRPYTHLLQKDNGILYTACPLKDKDGKVAILNGSSIPVHDLIITVEKSQMSSMSDDELQKLQDYIQTSVGVYLTQKFGLPIGM